MTQGDFEVVTALVGKYPDASVSDLAKEAGWLLTSGAPHKMKVWRILQHVKRVKAPGARGDFATVSAIIQKHPCRLSYAEISRKAGWYLGNGKPNGRKAARIRRLLRHGVRTPEDAKKFRSYIKNAR